MTDDHYPGAATARWLGYLGLIPFLVFGTLGLLGSGFAVRATIAYGAVIVSFVGAIHWGLALHNGGAQSARLYFVSVLPSLVAWPALLLAPRPGLALLIAAFLLVWIYERGNLWSSLFPPWFARLRTRLTAVAVVILTLLLAAAPGL